MIKREIRWRQTRRLKISRKKKKDEKFEEGEAGVR